MTVNELYHHGILGMKWGRKNGPPYPLDASDHSAAEKKAGWRKSIDKNSAKTYSRRTNKIANDRNHRGLSEESKRAIKTGAIIAGSALAMYGVYKLSKSGFIDQYLSSGESAVNTLFGDVPSTGLKRINENLGDSLKNANPLRGKPEGANNCTYAAVAGFLRTIGYDVTAKSTGGNMQNLGGVLENCFKNVKVYEGSAVKFARSPKDAAEMLIKRFGDNASGVVGIQWLGSGGHTFNWNIKDGIVSFLDFQQGAGDSQITRAYWQMMDPNGSLTFARLDGLELNFDDLNKYVNRD